MILYPWWDINLNHSCKKNTSEFNCPINRRLFYLLMVHQYWLVRQSNTDKKHFMKAFLISWSCISMKLEEQQNSFSVCFHIPFYVSAEWNTWLSQLWNYKFIIFFCFFRISDFLFLTKIIIDSFSKFCWTIIYIWSFYNINSPKSQLYKFWDDIQKNDFLQFLQLLLDNYLYMNFL